MWQLIAKFIFQARWAIMAFVVLLTCFWGYVGVVNLQVSQDYLNVAPKNDPDLIAYHQFRKQFGEEGNTLLIALESPDWFQAPKLNDLKQVSQKIDGLQGVKSVLNITQASQLVIDENEDCFVTKPLMPNTLSHDSDAVALRTLIKNQPFYEGLLFDTTYHILLTAVSFDKQTMDSKRKHALQKEIEALFEPLVQKHQLQIHYAGLPYIRTFMTRALPKELALFVVLSLGFTCLALFYCYRSFYSMIFPLVLLFICAVSCLGIIGLLDYKITLLTGMLPAIIIILGIPPSIFMLSEYLEEYQKTKNKAQALTVMLQKLGLVTFMINANTAFGFLTLYFTDIIPLKEFGLVAFLATMWAYVLTILLIPSIFSLLPPPSEHQLKQLHSPVASFLTRIFNQWVIRKKVWVYSITLILLVISGIGIAQLKTISFMTDDLPAKANILPDLAFMEKNFKGVLPFEIVLDFGKPGAARKTRNVRLISQLQDSLHQDQRISRTLSIVDAMKWSRQAIYDGDPAGYNFPASNELDIIGRYAQHTQNKRNEKKSDSLKSGSQKSDSKYSQTFLFQNLVDSSYQKVRITGYIKDLGSVETPVLISKVEKQIQAIFGKQSPKNESSKSLFSSLITGTTRLFLKTNEYLIDNLVWSLLTTFLIIGLQMWILFSSFRMMLISLGVNIVPLIVVAGIMGFLKIPLKPSTALIYELAFGIAIDSAIHYLAAYRLNRRLGKNKTDAIEATNLETGSPVIITSVILLLGFGVFMFSAFGSTRALGVLTSSALLISVFSNLILMPVLVRSFDSNKMSSSKALIDTNTQ